MKILLLLPLLLLVGCHSGKVPERSPNIVVLFADDLGYGDLSSYGHPVIRTPHLDQMASEGQRWTSFYSAAPVCSPSRGALLTGRLPNRTGLYGAQIPVMFPNDTAGIPETEQTLAEALGDLGYATAIIGKWHLGDAPEQYPTRHGFDSWFGLPYSNDMDWVGHRTLDEMVALRIAGRGAEAQADIAARGPKYADPRVAYWNVPLIRSERRGGSTGAEAEFADTIVERPAAQATLTARYTAEALEFIDAHQQQPFFLYLPYTMPHTPLFRSDAFVDKSLGGRYGDVIEELDASVGAILDHLRKRNIAENTLVIFTSDNGPWLVMNQESGSAGMLRQGKGTTFEGGVRVPGVFWWPGQVLPSVQQGIGSIMDIYQTVLSLVTHAGGATDGRGATDSLDLSSTLLQGSPSVRDEMPYYRAGELMAYRKGQYKLALIEQGAYNQAPEKTLLNPPRLYDLNVDPSERFDIALTNPKVVQQLTQAVAKHRAGLVSAQPIFDTRLERLSADN